ncbi:DNA gyrase subunit A [Candidatus Falkowbacteria bacterium]|nr:DNA gyrase subunit A [Candidatus Falkowbacteria bacterium]
MANKPKKPSPKKPARKFPAKNIQKARSSKSPSSDGQSISPNVVAVASEKIGIGKIIKQQIVEEMQQSYLDYAMSVIVSRALPDVRDGLKPVHRRILYAMWSIGLKPGAKFRKSATVVGEVLGKYHPHGDVAVYDALVRMAQDFSLRYPLIKGQGNFGSMDGDGAAAMRYTESKLAGIAEELLTDIEKETVQFIPNYDGSHNEPTVLPAKLPNLLLNGTMGIAVGMATSIAPHNLGEICDGIIHLIETPEATVDDLVKLIKGPDFPTGGIIFDNSEIKQMYATGKGGIVLRAKTEIVEAKGGSFNIIVSEVPYQINKAVLLEKIAALVKDKKMEGIKDLRDESNKEGVRVVIELKKDAYPKKILNSLFKLTDLQTTFHSNMLALIDGIQPRVLTLKMILEEYIKHRKEIIRKRTEYDLKKAKDRAHILEGLKMALAKIDAIIKTIKASRDKEVAKINLIKKFRLSDRQAIAILEMRLQQLANLERLKIEQELKEKLALIKELESILGSAKKISAIIKKEIAEIKQNYGDERKTQIIAHGVKNFSTEDLVPNEDTIVTITKDGYIKRLPPETFRSQSRGGKGVSGLTTKEEDIVEHFFTTTTHSDILFFTTSGRVFQLKAYDIPKGSRTAKGQAIVNFLQLAPNEKVSSALPLNELKDYKYLMMVTKKGNIKKVSLKDFDNIRKSGLIAIRLRKDDYLEWVEPSAGQDEIILVTGGGQAIKTGNIVAATVVNAKAEEQDIIIISTKGQVIRISVKYVSVLGRATQGVRLMKFKAPGDKVASATFIQT